jgi:transposase-like protein
MARPTDYSQEMADRICESLSEGMSLREICRSEEMPNKATVFRWLNAHKEFSDQYARAREEQAETLADEIVAIVDSAASPLMVDGLPLNGPDGKPILVADTAAVAHARLKMDARKWVASKLKPKKYGEKLGIGGAEDLPPVGIELIERVIIDPKK